jgi:hypothetical protein
VDGVSAGDGLALGGDVGERLELAFEVALAALR